MQLCIIHPFLTSLYRGLTVFSLAWKNRQHSFVNVILLTNYRSEVLQKFSANFLHFGCWHDHAVHRNILFIIKGP